MAEPSLELQKALRDRLIASPTLTALVPATSILDANGRPEQMPCIRMGTGQVLPDDGIARNRYGVWIDLHVFAKEPGLSTVKTVAGEIRDALETRLYSLDFFYCGDLHVSNSRYLRDPDGVHSHAVVTVEAHLIRQSA